MMGIFLKNRDQLRIFSCQLNQKIERIIRILKIPFRCEIGGVKRVVSELLPQIFRIRIAVIGRDRRFQSIQCAGLFRKTQTSGFFPPGKRSLFLPQEIGECGFFRFVFPISFVSGHPRGNQIFRSGKQALAETVLKQKKKESGIVFDRSFRVIGDAQKFRELRTA